MADLRLPWRKQPPRGFIAHPEGERFPSRAAVITYDATSSTKWRWQVTYDLAKVSGHGATSQLAADAATAAWPRAKADAATLAGEAAAAEALRTLVYRQCDKGDLSISAFEIETSSSDRLRHIIWLIQDRKALSGPAQPLVAACSAELGRRRRGE